MCIIVQAARIDQIYAMRYILQGKAVQITAQQIPNPCISSLRANLQSYICNSVAPPLVLFVITNDIQIHIKRPQHHRHSKLLNIISKKQKKEENDFS